MRGLRYVGTSVDINRKDQRRVFELDFKDLQRSRGTITLNLLSIVSDGKFKVQAMGARVAKVEAATRLPHGMLPLNLAKQRTGPGGNLLRPGDLDPTPDDSMSPELISGDSSSSGLSDCTPPSGMSSRLADPYSDRHAAALKRRQ